MKRITAVLLSVVAFLGLFCACAQQQDPDPTQVHTQMQEQGQSQEPVTDQTVIQDTTREQDMTQAQTPVQAETKFYLVLGDSIAYGSGLTNPKEACYGKIVADTNGYEYSNRSVPGHTTADLINRLKEESVTADLEKADIINISIGGNDFLKSDLKQLMTDCLVNGDYTGLDKIAEGFYDNLCEIISIINSHNADAVILVQTLYNPQSDFLRVAFQMGADRINDAIMKYDSENPGEIVIADVGTALGADMANYASDTIHPSAQGNEMIAQTVLNKLYELNLGSNTQPVITVKGEDKV